MVVYTDSIDYAEQVLPQSIRQWSSPRLSAPTDISLLSSHIFKDKTFVESFLETDIPWKNLFLTESSPCSQYDLLIELSRKGNRLPDGILCVAGAGDRFHGFKNRPWSAASGNIHLSVYLAPAKPIAHFGIGFTILAAVSVVEALDSLPSLENRAKIKWVNDILINDAKVCGVLAYTQTVKDTVTAAVLGIGLNVETRPTVEPTPFVPRVASLRDFASEPDGCNQRAVFAELIRVLGRNYGRFVDGGYHSLLERYRRHSAVIGRDVTLCAEDSGAKLDVIAEGKVTDLGENLELFLEGFDQPFSKGRLILKKPRPPRG